MKPKSIVLTILFLLSSMAAAETCRPVSTAATAQGYFISGILEKSDHGVKVKLVQLIEVAASETEAMERFVQKVTDRYPNYRIADTIVSASGSKGAVPCDQPLTDRDMI